MSRSTKRCNRCGTEQDISEFYGHKAMADGRLNACKTCVRKRVRDNRIATIDAVRHADRQRAKQPHRKRQRAEYQQRNQQRATQRVQLWRTANPQKHAAHKAVRNAIARGNLTPQPCEICGDVAVAHHDDYNQPLAVRWLCRKHHGQHHYPS